MTGDTPDWRPATRGRVRAHRLAQAAQAHPAPVFVAPAGAYAVANYLMPNGAVLQSRWYERTDDITLTILPAEREGA